MRGKPQFIQWYVHAVTGVEVDIHHHERLRHYEIQWTKADGGRDYAFIHEAVPENELAEAVLRVRKTSIRPPA